MTPFAAIKALVDGRDGSLVTHHPGGRVAGWNAGGVDETISALPFLTEPFCDGLPSLPVRWHV